MDNPEFSNGQNDTEQDVTSMHTGHTSHAPPSKTSTPTTREKFNHVGRKLGNLLAKSHESPMEVLAKSHESPIIEVLAKSHESPTEVLDRDDDAGNIFDEIENPAFNPGALVSPKSKTPQARAWRTVRKVRTVATAVIHPISFAKTKAVSKVTVEEEPYLSEGADEDYLKAHDNLESSKSYGRTRASQSTPRQKERSRSKIQGDKQRVEELEELRRNRKVAWTTTHHVRRVLVVPLREAPPPRKDEYYVYDKSTGKRSLDWVSWLQALNHHAMINFAHNSLEHVDFAAEAPFDPQTLVRQISRLLVASSPWQIWFSELRQLYRWEDRRKTQQWFFIWFVVWWLDYVVTFCLAYVAYITLRNRFGLKNADGLRESYRRIRDRNSVAYKFNEMTTKYGDKWFEPAFQAAGPGLEKQITDMASFLETLSNFYDWRVPRLTWATLFWFLCAILLGTLTSTQNSMKVVWMFCILDFFLGFWVSSFHPKYRHVVNSLKWIFWGIPDDPEWSFMYLRERAQQMRAKLIGEKVQPLHNHEDSHDYLAKYDGALDPPEQTPTKPSIGAEDDTFVNGDESDDADSFATADSTTNVVGSLDILAFHCHYKAFRGRLIIFSDGMRFERLGRESWRRTWSELIEVSKSDVARLGLGHKDTGLSVVFSDGDIITLEGFKGLKERDRVFNCLVGFSGLSFQVLPVGVKVDPRAFVKQVKEGTWVNGHRL